MQQVKQWGVMLLVLFVAVITAEVLSQPLAPFMAFTGEHRTALLAIITLMLAAGFIALLGGMIYMAFRPQPQSDLAASSILRQNGTSSMAPPVERQDSAGQSRFEQTIWRGVYMETSYRSLKDARSSGAWWSDARWRLIFFVMAGALLLWFGFFSLFLVIGPLWVRLLVAGIMLYASIRITWNILQA